ncbi:MAG: hypothetical protein Q8K86_07005 [Candidatus Nanopelagicaceae bacterium]|nr:hypothetical protein [Candidatus Nanopelagicaceae bacterium]
MNDLLLALAKLLEKQHKVTVLYADKMIPRDPGDEDDRNVDEIVVHINNQIDLSVWMNVPTTLGLTLSGDSPLRGWHVDLTDPTVDPFTAVQDVITNILTNKGW